MRGRAVFCWATVGVQVGVSLIFECVENTWKFIVYIKNESVRSYKFTNGVAEELALSCA